MLPQPTAEQKTQIIELTKRGLATGEIAEKLGLEENQVLHHKRKFPLKSRIVSVFATPRIWFPGIPYVVVFKAVLTDSREITIGTSQYGGPGRRQNNDCERILLLLSQFVGEEIEYATRRAPIGTRRRDEESKPYFEAKFSKLQPTLKQEFGYR